MIPDEVVEAAMVALAAGSEGPVHRAAVLRLMAQAWDKGLIAGYGQRLTEDNPYRSA